MKNNPEWYYNENPVGVDYLDPEIAREYNKEHQKFRNFEDETEDIVQMLGITPEDTVLDFGCGTGGIALNLTKYCKRVIGVDISREMLDILEEKAKKQDITNIETHCAGFLTYNHDQSVKIDKIVSMVALHHLPDFWKSVALLNMAKILKTGGKLYLFDVVFTFNIQDHQKTIGQMINQMENAAGDSMADELKVHIRDEFSTYDWIMEGLLERAGFSIDSVDVKADNIRGYICSKV
nr:class I SAM-dependent methyltransferase [uncultured Methanobacterium sp.]